MLDSSPVASQSQPIEIPRVLKRSASTASLPTPPRTRHKRRHGRSLHDAEGDSGSGTASEDEEQKHHYKKRRVSQAQEDDDEEAFWTGQPGASSKKASSGDAIRSPSPDEDEDDETSSPVPLLFRKNRQSNSALASPPPSHRKTTSTAPIAAPALVLRSATTASPPETPKGNPVRDSPNNPFLESPLDLAGDAYDDDHDDGANATAAPHELATITYVHRGVRRSFPNPFFDATTNRPLSPIPASLLDPADPAYEPDLRCPPKVLFPVPGKAKRKPPTASPTPAPKSKHAMSKRSGGKAAKQLMDSDDEQGAEEEDAFGPVKLSFGDRSPRTRERSEQRGARQQSSLLRAPGPPKRR